MKHMNLFANNTNINYTVMTTGVPSSKLPSSGHPCFERLCINGNLANLKKHETGPEITPHRFGETPQNFKAIPLPNNLLHNTTHDSIIHINRIFAI
jgi:hypothetical protein